MAGTYLTWLADVLRAAGCNVVEYQGWKTRARSSGGYAAGRPVCVMWHHTASSTSASNDVYYMSIGSPDSPVANIYIARDGAVWVMAAGASNTNGKGNSMSFSRGTVPMDKMNEWAVGMEIGNGGTGESYPQVQIDAAFRASNAINAHLGNQPTDVCTHHHYAPTRKIDPAKAQSVQGPWQPRSINSNGTWNVDDLRAECQRRAVPAPPTPNPVPPYPKGDDMIAGIWQRSDNPGVKYIVWSNGTKQWITDGGHFEGAKALCRINGVTDEVQTCSDGGLFAAMGVVLPGTPNDPTCDQWGNKP